MELNPELQSQVIRTKQNESVEQEAVAPGLRTTVAHCMLDIIIIADQIRALDTVY